MVDEHEMVEELEEMLDWGEAGVTLALGVWAQIPINRCEWVFIPFFDKLLDKQTCTGGCVLTWRDCGNGVVWVPSLVERQAIVVCTDSQGQSRPLSQS